MKTLPAGKGCAAEAAARARPADDLLILPSAVDAWRITLGVAEHQADLVDAAVVVPQPAAGPGSCASARVHKAGGRHEVLQFDWNEIWLATLQLNSRHALDLRPYRAGTLAFDLDVGELALGSIKVRLDGAPGLGRSVNLIEQGRAWAGKGWQRVALRLACFERDGAEFSNVTLPFALEGAGTGRVRVANVGIHAAGMPTIACAGFRSETVTPAVAKEHHSIDWWLLRHAEKLREKDQLLAAGTPPQLVFIGDSITQGWEEVGLAVWQRCFAQLPALALGYGGDRTENVLWRLQDGEIDGLAPRAVVLMIGTNNAGMHPPEMTAAGIARLLAEIRQRLPAAQVLLLGIFPRGPQPGDPLRAVNERVNHLVAGLADGQRVHFRDIGPAFLNAAGSLSEDVMPDGLHLSERGYTIWQRAMAPTLQRLLEPAA